MRANGPQILPFRQRLRVVVFHRPSLGFVVRTAKANCITYIGYALCKQCKTIFIYSYKLYIHYKKKLQEMKV